MPKVIRRKWYSSGSMARPPKIKKPLGFQEALDYITASLFRRWMLAEAKRGFGGDTLSVFFGHPAIKAVVIAITDPDCEIAVNNCMWLSSWCISLAEQKEPNQEAVVACVLCLREYAPEFLMTQLGDKVEEICDQWSKAHEPEPTP